MSACQSCKMDSGAPLSQTASSRFGAIPGACFGVSSGCASGLVSFNFYKDTKNHGSQLQQHHHHNVKRICRVNPRTVDRHRQRGALKHATVTKLSVHSSPKQVDDYGRRGIASAAQVAQVTGPRQRQPKKWRRYGRSNWHKSA